MKKKEVKCGLYCILNLENGKFYIGSSYDIYRRWIHHKSNLNRREHCNPHLQNSWNKHGKKSFIFEIIEECLREDLYVEEQKYLDEYVGQDFCYNICPIARGGSTLSKFSIEDCHLLLSRKNAGERAPELAKEFDVSHSAIYRAFERSGGEMVKNYSRSEESKEKQRQRMLDPNYNPMSDTVAYQKMRESKLPLSEDKCLEVLKRFATEYKLKGELSKEYKIMTRQLNSCMKYAQDFLAEDSFLKNYDLSKTTRFNQEECDSLFNMRKEGLSMKEVAEKVGVNVTTVKKATTRATDYYHVGMSKSGREILANNVKNMDISKFKRTFSDEMCLEIYQHYQSTGLSQQKLSEKYKCTPRIIQTTLSYAENYLI